MAIRDKILAFVGVLAALFLASNFRLQDQHIRPQSDTSLIQTANFEDDDGYGVDGYGIG